MSEEKKVFHLDDIIDNEKVTTEEPVVTEESAVVDTAIPNPDKQKRVLVTPKNSGMKIEVDENGDIKGKEVGELKELPKPGLSPEKAFEKEQLDLIDKNIARVKKELMEEHIIPFKEKCKEIKLEKELNGEIAPDVITDQFETIDEDNVSDDGNKKENLAAIRSTEKVELNDMSHFQDDLANAATIELDDDILKKYENDLNDDDDDVTDDSLDEDTVSLEDKEKEKEEFNERARIIESAFKEDSQPIDISDFKYSNRPISINKAIDKPTTVESASVPLFNTGRMITLTSLSGAEIVKLSPSRNDTDLTILRTQFNMIYNHDISEDKPKTFTAWMRSIDAGDLGQLHFGLYKATFGDSNYISYQCDKCQSFFMVKQPIESMYRFNKDVEEEQKKRIKDIEAHGSVQDDIKAREELYVISPKYAVIIKPKSLYNLIEPNFLDDEFKEKLGAVVNLMGYIGSIYYIDQENKTLRPIDIKADNQAIGKTFRHKCLAMAKLIASITPDEYAMLSAKITNIAIKEGEASNIFEYIIPGTECQGEFKEGEFKGNKCTNKIPDEPTQAISLLFTRHQLAMQSTLRVE